MLAEKEVTLQVSQPAREWLADKGYEPAFGARPMARVVEQHLKKPLADAILFGALKDGGIAKVERKGDGVAITTKAK
jgi:ATP-dependent Clp protease ATP-binding subunit ClpA